MGPKGLAACALTVVVWITLSYAALVSVTAAQVIAVGAVSVGAAAMLLSVWAFSTGKRLFRRATRPHSGYIPQVPTVE